MFSGDAISGDSPAFCMPLRPNSRYKRLVQITGGDVKFKSYGTFDITSILFGNHTKLSLNRSLKLKIPYG